MKVKKLLFTALLAGGMMLSACGGSKDPTKPATPSGDPTPSQPATPSGQPGTPTPSGQPGTPTPSEAEPTSHSLPTVPVTETYDATIWVSEVDGMDTLTKAQVAEFTRTTGIEFNLTVEKQSESNAATKMIQDVTNGADIFCFAQDQLVRLVQAGALSKVGKKAAATLLEENDVDAGAAITFGEDVYAYPMTSDNGYFLYYDKTVIHEDDVNDFAKILKACEDADMKLSFEAETSGWYVASWFFGAGCHSVWAADNEGNFTGVDDDFNSEKGLIAARAMYNFMSSPAYLSSSDGGDFSKGSAALVSGTWAYNAVKSALGDNMGVAELPSYTVDGQSYHLGSYKGCKLMGVKPQVDAKRGAALQKLATFLTNQQAQLERFNEVAWGPSNLKAQKNEAVLANPALTAVRNQAPYATTQGQIHGSWWNLSTTLATAIKDSAGDVEAMQQALVDYKAGLDNLFSLDTSAWIFVGAHNGWDNTDMNQKAVQVEGEEEGILEVTIEMPEGDYLGGRFVHPGEWGNDMGGTIVDAESQALIDVAASTSGDCNIVFLEAGEYKLTLNVNVPSIHIEKL